MLRRICLLISYICFFSYLNQGKAQYYYYNDKYYDADLVVEAGGSVGLINCITDLGGQKSKTKKYFNEINWKNSHASKGFYLGVLYKEVVGVRLEAQWGEVGASDSLVKPFASRYKRNLSFKSNIQEVSMALEFYPLMLKYHFDNPPRFSPYIVMGIGWFSFNPQANLNGVWIDLQPLHTEGQGFKEFPDRKPYKLSQANLLFGAAMKFELSPNINLRVEWIHRYLFTDYLDDASTKYINPDLFSKYLTPSLAAQALQLHKRTNFKTSIRGDPKNTDSYFTVNFKLGLTLGRTRR